MPETMGAASTARRLVAEVALVAFHSGDIPAGAAFAFVTADSGGCAALALDSQCRPASGF